MENNDIIVVNNGNEVENYNFQRVDFNNPETILSYGSDILDEMASVVSSSSVLASKETVIPITPDDFNDLVDFGKTLDDTEKKKIKEQNSSELVKKSRKLLKRIFKSSPESTSYKTTYDQYREKIAALADGVKKVEESEYNAVELRKAYIKDLEPKITELEVLIAQGYSDKEAYDNETNMLNVELSNPELSDEEKQNITVEIRIREKLSETFGKQLSVLSSAVISYKAQINAYRLQQNVALSTMIDCRQYSNITSPILQGQGSVMVFNKQQAETIAIVEAAKNAANNAIKQNADQTFANIEKSIELSNKGVISNDTLEYLVDVGQKGVDLIKKGREEFNKNIEAQRTFLQKLDNTLNQSRTEIISMIGTVDEIKELPAADKPKVKKIGTINNNG